MLHQILVISFSVENFLVLEEELLYSQSPKLLFLCDVVECHCHGLVAAELHEPPLNAACLLTGRTPVQVQSPGPVGVNLVGSKALLHGDDQGSIVTATFSCEIGQDSQGRSS